MSNATRFYSLARHSRAYAVRAFKGALVLGWFVATMQFGSYHLTGSASVGEADVAEAPGVAIISDASAEIIRSGKARRTVSMPEIEEMALSDEMQRVRDWVSRRYRVSSVALEPVLVEAETRARAADLDPLLIVAMIAVESSFNPLAESHAGAQGLMQVIPRWHMDKIGEDAGEDALFDPRFNVQVGTLVLVEGLQRYGSLQNALQYYGGARNDPEARYTKRVLDMKQRLASAAR